MVPLESHRVLFGYKFITAPNVRKTRSDSQAALCEVAQGSTERVMGPCPWNGDKGPDTKAELIKVL